MFIVHISEKVKFNNNVSSISTISISISIIISICAVRAYDELVRVQLRLRAANKLSFQYL